MTGGCGSTPPPPILPLSLPTKPKPRSTRSCSKLTDGAVPAYTLTAGMKEWVHKQGVPITALDKDEMDRLCTRNYRRRSGACLGVADRGQKSSVDKIAAMLRRPPRRHGQGCVPAPRCRPDGPLQRAYCPAPQHASPPQDIRGRASAPGYFVRGHPHRRSRLYPTLYGKELGRPLHLLADAVRSFIWAKPSHVFIGGDIHPSKVALPHGIGREEWKMQSLPRRLTAGEGAGIYETTAAGIYNIPVQAK